MQYPSRLDFFIGVTMKRCAAAVLFAACLIPALSVQPAQADDAVRFMQKIKKELLGAARKRSQVAFHQAIRRHADIAHIGNNSLGTYAKRLPRSSRRDYYEGVRKFMARYFTDQSRAYDIVDADVVRPSMREGKYYLVDTKVYLGSGWSYNVRWQLKRRGNGRFKIIDTQVLGFWLTPFQRDLFVNYVQKAGGNIRALIWALNN